MPPHETAQWRRRVGHLDESESTPLPGDSRRSKEDTAVMETIHLVCSDGPKRIADLMSGRCGGGTMKLLSALVLSTVALVGFPASASADARHVTAPGTYSMSNPCTGEQVQVTATFHYLVFGRGDLTHSSGGTGVGLTSGNAYRYTRSGFETNTQGFFEVIHLISVGPGSDLTLSDQLGDDEDPVIGCS